jgi:lysozyme
MSVTMNVNAIVENLKIEEGFRTRPYVCSAGYLTIGFGRNISDSGLGISEEEAEYLLKNDVNRTIDEVRQRWPWFDDCDKAAREVLVELCFQLGAPRLSKFVKCLAALKADDNDTAAAELLDSKFAKQVPARAARLSIRLKSTFAMKPKN